MSRKKQQRNKRIPPNQGSNTLRIIGGDWRGRKLSFKDAPSLRPTPDRVRETLFNWLQGNIHGCYCLDLFAGSGALGFEALSRGAIKVIFVEKVAHAAKQIEDNLSLLTNDSPVIMNDAISFLSKTDQRFDIIFLDPPFRQNLLPATLEIITNKNLLQDNGLIYLEHEAEEHFAWDDYGLTELKKTKAGQVKSCLLQMKSL